MVRSKAIDHQSIYIKNAEALAAACRVYQMEAKVCSQIISSPKGTRFAAKFFEAGLVAFDLWLSATIAHRTAT